MFDRTKLRTVLEEVFPSAEMVSYLAECPLNRRQIRDAVAYAPLPLKRKRDLFLMLAKGKDTSYFRRQAGVLEKAIREMQPKPGEFFYLKSYCCFDPSERPEEKGLEPYLTWDLLLERIREFLGYLDADEQELAWFDAEKWSPDGTGKLKNEYDYTILGGEVCYVEHNTPVWDRYEFSEYQDVNLPVPFHAGDIVTADCRPFVPVSHAVILEVGDNQDCCCLQALYRKDDGTWDTGAVKHGYIFPGYSSPGFSPLYRLSTFHGQLPKEERLLERVSRYLNGDEERGAALWNHIFALAEKGRHKQTITAAEIWAYLEGNHDV